MVVKKIWNLLSLARVLEDNQIMTIKTKLWVKIKHEILEPDFILNQVNLHVDTKDNLKFHRMSFYFDLPKKIRDYPQIKVRILDSEYRILADGKTGSDKLRLNFYTESSYIRIEFRSEHIGINNTYTLARIIQESLNLEEVLEEFNDESSEQLIEAVLENEEGLKSLRGLERHQLWSYLKRWECPSKTNTIDTTNVEIEIDSQIEDGSQIEDVSQIEDGSQTEVDPVKDEPDLRIFTLHKNLLLLNRGNLLFDILREKEGKELAGILLFILPIEEHYKDSDILSRYSGLKPCKDDLIKFHSRGRSLSRSYDRIIESIEQYKSDVVETAKKVDELLNERNRKLSELPLLEIQVMGDLDNSSYYKEINHKKVVLEELKAHLMKELIKQNNNKKFSETLSAHILLEKETSYIKVLEIYARHVVSLYNMIGQDLLIIEDEIDKVCNLKSRLDRERSDKDRSRHKEEIERMKTHINDLTTEINEHNNRITEINMKMGILEIQRLAVFYSFLENLIETKLRLLYSIPDANNREEI